jgi:hypothetical protein
MATHIVVYSGGKGQIHLYIVKMTSSKFITFLWMIKKLKRSAAHT